MKSAKDLRTEYLQITEQMKDLYRRAKEEDRDLTPDEDQQFLRMHERQSELEISIQARTAMEAMNHSNYGNGLLTDPQEIEDTRSNAEQYRDAFHNWVKKGKAELDAKDKLYLERGTSTITTETSGIIYGGYAVPDELDREWVQVLKQYGGMMDACKVIRTQTGGTWYKTYTDDTSTAALLTAEASATTIQDFSFSRMQLGSHTYRSQVLLSLEEIQDEQVGVVSELNNMLAIRMGRALNTAFTTGDGSSKPTGILASSGGASTGKTAASATAVTASELLDLLHSVDPAYRNGPSVGFMFNDTTLSFLKKLTLGSSDSTPLWVPSTRDSEPATIWGYKYWINQDFPSMTTGNKTIAFGDFSTYIIREVRQPTFVRLNELYMANLSQGFLAFGRYDGKLLPISAVKVLAQA